MCFRPPSTTHTYTFNMFTLSLSLSHTHTHINLQHVCSLSLSHTHPHSYMWTHTDALCLQHVSYFCNFAWPFACSIVWSGKQVISLTWSTLRAWHLVGTGMRLKDISLVSQKWRTTSFHSRSILKSESRSSLRHWISKLVICKAL